MSSHCACPYHLLCFFSICLLLLEIMLFGPSEFYNNLLDLTTVQGSQPTSLICLCPCPVKSRGSELTEAGPLQDDLSNVESVLMDTDGKVRRVILGLSANWMIAMPFFCNIRTNTCLESQVRQGNTFCNTEQSMVIHTVCSISLDVRLEESQTVVKVTWQSTNDKSVASGGCRAHSCRMDAVNK